MYWSVVMKNIILICMTVLSFDSLLIDKDECLSGEFTCDPNAMCRNTIGNYTCQCLPPFFGDGFSCSRKNLAMVLIMIRIYFFLQVDLSYNEHNNALVW